MASLYLCMEHYWKTEIEPILLVVNHGRVVFWKYCIVNIVSLIEIGMLCTIRM